MKLGRSKDTSAKTSSTKKNTSKKKAAKAASNGSDVVMAPADMDVFFGTLRSEFDEDDVLPRVLTQVRDTYLGLRASFDAGEITKTELAEQLSGLRGRSPMGVEWTIGASSGSWYRRISGTSWLAAAPPTIGPGSGESDAGWTGPYLEPHLPGATAPSTATDSGYEGAAVDEHSWASVAPAPAADDDAAQAEYLAALMGGAPIMDDPAGYPAPTGPSADLPAFGEPTYPTDTAYPGEGDGTVDTAESGGDWNDDGLAFQPYDPNA